MAYDPSHTEALENIRRLHAKNFGHYHDIALDSEGRPLEFECKLKHKPFYHNIGPQSAAESGARDCLSLLARMSYEINTYHDKETVPNDYILTSAGLDSVIITPDSQTPQPSAEFRLNDMQLRVRFPIYTGRNGASDAPIVPLNQYDANIKDHLSAMSAGEHRIELETTVEDPTKCLLNLKACADKAFPSQVIHLNDSDLRVTCLNMTSRSSFFMVMQIPGTPHHALIHGSYDSSRAVPNFTHAFADKTTRNEIELEVKALMGDHPALSNPAVQVALINRLFDKVYETAEKHSFVKSTHSKMEEAEAAVARFIREHTEFPTIRKEDPHLRQFISGNFKRAAAGERAPIGIGEYAFALMRDVKISDIFRPLTGRYAFDSPLVRTATGMPDPTKLLPKNLLGRASLQLAAV